MNPNRQRRNKLPCKLTSNSSDSEAVLSWESEGGGLAVLISPLIGVRQKNSEFMKIPGHFAKLRNDNGIAKVQIGMKEFECIGATPPHDHPHVYLNMGLSKSMLCPYCATSFHYEVSLAPDGITPIDCRYKYS